MATLASGDAAFAPKTNERSIGRTISWALFALVIVMILPDVLEYWVRLPWGGNTPFFIALTLFSLVHCGVTLGARRMATFSG